MSDVFAEYEKLRKQNEPKPEPKDDGMFKVDENENISTGSEDVSLEELRKQISELQAENEKLKNNKEQTEKGVEKNGNSESDFSIN